MGRFRVALFAEDSGHEDFLLPLVKRIAAEFSVPNDVELRSVRGGVGKALKQLEQFVGEFERGHELLPDLLLVGRDANCKGYNICRKEIEQKATNYPAAIEFAIPEPHIERWLLLDPAAFKSVLGKGCSLPDQKCERDRYKQLLVQAVIDADREPLDGGLEYAEEIVGAMDLDRIAAGPDSLGKLIVSLRHQFRRWQADGGPNPA